MFLLLLSIVVHGLLPTHAMRSVARDGAFVGYSERDKVVEFSQKLTGALAFLQDPDPHCFAW